MKKNIRYLIIMLAVLVVLGGGAAALLLTQPAAEEDASSSSLVASEMVTDRETSEVATVTVENPQRQLCDGACGRRHRHFFRGEQLLGGELFQQHLGGLYH